MFTQLVDYRERFAEQHKRTGEVFYLTVLGMYLLVHFLYGSLWFWKYPSLNSTVLLYDAQQILAIIGLVKIIVFNRFTDWREPALFMTTLLVVLVGCRYAKQNYFMYYVIFLYGAKDIDFKRIVKLFIGVVGSALLVTIIGALIGIVPNATVTHGLGTNLRFSMGMVYTTDFAARVFYLCMAYVLLRRFRLLLPEKLSLITITLWVYIVTDARLDTLLLLLLIMCVVFYDYVVKIIKKIGNVGLVILEALGIGSIFALSWLFNPQNKLMALCDHLLSGRLTEGHIALTNYHVVAFGQYIIEQGNGGFHPHIVHYFFIDSSYIAALLKNGGVAFILLMILIVYATVHFNNQHAYPLVIAVLLVVLSSIIDQHLSALSFDIIFLATLANITAFTPKHGEVSMNWRINN